MNEEKALIASDFSPLGYDNACDVSLSSSSFSSEESDEYEQTTIITSLPDAVSSVTEKPKCIRDKMRERVRQKLKPVNVEDYAHARVMTKVQEQWNAISMIPPSIFCLYYMFSLSWMGTEMLAEEGRQEYQADPAYVETSGSDGISDMLNKWLGDPETGCLPTTYLPAIPPLGVLAVVIATCCHAPFSIIYHYTFAHKLDWKDRVNHWSRRMDQAMIHFASALFAYASSGSSNYFLACAVYNMDCAYRLFLPQYRPRANQTRAAIAVLAYIIPFLRRGDVERFGELVVIYCISGWLFSKYPIGGWSHAVFHLFIGLMPAVILPATIELTAAQAQLKLVAQCSVILQEVST